MGEGEARGARAGGRACVRPAPCGDPPPQGLTVPVPRKQQPALPEMTELKRFPNGELFVIGRG